MSKTIHCHSLLVAFLGLVMTGCSSRLARIDSLPSPTAEDRAVAFLQREVPAWSQDNGCYSCHNNGDAARALYAASRRGYRFSKGVLADTTKWVSHPERWEDNKGDPGFSDQRLATVQFAASLAAAVESGAVRNPATLNAAAIKVARAQAPDGSWPVDVANPVGSPATYGTALATYMAWDVLSRASSPEVRAATQRAGNKLRSIKPDSIPNAAVLLLFLRSERGSAANIRTALDFLRRAQTRDGGWGPYADSPPEAFDTALALLAIAGFPDETAVPAMVRRGREFLAGTQSPDGSWPATTRPADERSYAQQISTTGWATLALLETR